MIQEFQEKLNEAAELIQEAASLLDDKIVDDDEELTQDEIERLFGICAVILQHATAAWIDRASSK